MTFVAIDGYRSVFTREEVDSHSLYLAFKVNGVTLPLVDGLPVRLVAGKLVGGRWVKVDQGNPRRIVRVLLPCVWLVSTRGRGVTGRAVAKVQAVSADAVGHVDRRSVRVAKVEPCACRGHNHLDMVGVCIDGLN